MGDKFYSLRVSFLCSNSVLVYSIVVPVFLIDVLPMAPDAPCASSPSEPAHLSCRSTRVREGVEVRLGRPFREKLMPRNKEKTTHLGFFFSSNISLL